ncbi:MAG: FAD-binding oxidoreductase [Planctomycetes bacterium]|nr:FAD-binding oxidoreductase [Planctomycetota bacterium]
MERAKFVILGAGIAGAAAAYGLARRGVRDVVVLERDPIPGAHASGRNASLVRRNLKTATDCELALAAERWLRRPPADFPRAIEWRDTGSLLLYQNAERARVEADFELQRRAGLAFEILSSKEALAKQPMLAPETFDAAQWTPGDGRINIINLLHGMLEFAAARGARILTNIKVNSLIVEKGRCAGAETNRGAFRAETVVNAAGGWANFMINNAADPLAMTPCRRTMVVTENIGADGDRPFAWHDGRGFYFREDNGGILMSPCDEIASQNCNEAVDPAWVARARGLAREFVPSVANAKTQFTWCGLRTLTFDHEMYLGHDAALPGLFWVAGLGGHGVTHSPILAEIAADLLLNGSTDSIDAARVAPRRARVSA